MKKEKDLLAEADRTISQQRAEIDRLKGELSDALERADNADGLFDLVQARLWALEKKYNEAPMEGFEEPEEV